VFDRKRVTKNDENVFLGFFCPREGVELFDGRGSLQVDVPMIYSLFGFGGPSEVNLK